MTKKIHDVKNISFKNSSIVLEVDGKEYSIDLTTQSKKLAEAPLEVKNNFILSFSGYGIHWPDIDEDLSIDGLIGVKHALKQKVSV